MFKHIAVVLRGHERTWHQIYPDCFKFWEGIAENIDYYYISWLFPGRCHQATLKTFEGKNLVKFLLFEPVNHYFQAYLGPAWLSYHLLPFKKRREKEVTYDALFDTRPDILYRRAKEFGEPLSIIKPEPMCLYTTSFESGHRRNMNDPVNPGARSLALSDWFFMMQSNVFDIMSERWIDEGMTGSQIQLREFAEQNGVTTCLLDWVESVIVRPFSVHNPRVDLTTDSNWLMLNDLRGKWVSMPFDEKQLVLNSTGQRTEDWDTPTMRNFNR